MAIGTSWDLAWSSFLFEVKLQFSDLSLLLLMHAELGQIYANRKHKPTTINKVKIMVATQREVATGALAVNYICLMMKVFSY